MFARPAISRERVSGPAQGPVKLVLASRNANKLRELRRALPEWEIELLDAPDEPVEDGGTFLANARIKARHGRMYAGAEDWVAGEDSGIEELTAAQRDAAAAPRE
jgi:inosine/xanthosine triphosphate pyrophosphatase family protein